MVSAISVLHSKMNGAPTAVRITSHFPLVATRMGAERKREGAGGGHTLICNICLSAEKMCIKHYSDLKINFEVLAGSGGSVPEEGNSMMTSLINASNE